MEKADVVNVLESRRLQLTAWLMAMLRDRHTCEDLVQEMVVKAIDQPDHFKDANHVVAWARTTLRHRAINYIQRYRDRMVALDEGALDALCEHSEEHETIDDPEKAEALKKCLRRLPAKSAKLLQLRYRQELSGPAIAESVGKSPDAVYQSLYRIHKRLRDCMESFLGRSAEIS